MAHLKNSDKIFNEIATEISGKYVKVSPLQFEEPAEASDVSDSEEDEEGSKGGLAEVPAPPPTAPVVQPPKPVEKTEVIPVAKREEPPKRRKLVPVGALIYLFSIDDFFKFCGKFSAKNRA